MFSRTLGIITTSIFLFSAGLHAGSEAQTKAKVSEYFRKAFNVPGSDIQLRFVHPEEVDLQVREDCHLVIESRHTTPRLGYQILWLKVFDKEYLEKTIPITVNASIYLNVLTVKKKMNRGEIITRDKIAYKRLKVSGGYENYILDRNSVEGMITKQVIKKNTIIRRSMVRVPPDVKKGDAVTVQLVSGDLTVITEGKSKQDGMIGESVKVVCKPTGKKILGTVQSPKWVVVHLR